MLVWVALAVACLSPACSSGGRPGPETGGVSGSGTGGTAGAAGTARTGGAGGNSCSERDSLWSALQAWTTGPVPIADRTGGYDGPAVVERSTLDEMVLFFASSGAGATADPAGEFHSTLSGWSDLPVLPLGASVWFSKHPLANPMASFIPQTDSFQVRAAEGGMLILATSTAGTAPPISVSNRTTTCVGSGAGCEDGTTTYYSVDVEGDTPVTIDNSTSIVTIGGRAYDIRVGSFDESPSSHKCSDYFARGGTSMDVRLEDVTGLALPAGVLPACHPGNDRTLFLGFVSPVGSYDGAVTYLGREPVAGGGLQFGTAGAVTTTVYDDSGSFLAEPMLGQELWLTAQPAGTALRASQNGDPVVAQIPLAHASAASTAPVVGIGISSAQGCAYSTDASGNITYLTDAVLDGSPSVRLPPGTIGTVQIAGQPYHAMNRAGVDVAIWK
jgi:hypothetical protein